MSEYNLREDLIKIELAIKKNNLDFVIGNTISAFSKNENEILIINKKGKSIHKKGKKEILANDILDIIT